MARIAMQFVWHKKKSSFLLILIVALSLALMLAIGPMFETTREQIFEAYASRYGLQHGTIFYLDAAKVQRLEEKEEELSFGLFSNYGQWTLRETEQPLTLGFFSEEVIALGKLRLLEGRMPQSDKEIVLEKNSVQYRCPAGTKMGDMLTFSQGETEVQVRLVGILADYVGHWESFSSDSLIAGVNDFPRGLLGGEMHAEHTTQGALIYFWEYNPAVDIDRVAQLSQELNQINDFTYDYIQNGQLYTQVEQSIMQPFRSFRLLMIGIVMLGGALIMLVSAGLYINRYRESYAMLHVLGTGRQKIAQIYIGQCGLLLLLGALPGMGLAQCIAWIYGAIQHVSLDIFAGRNFIWPAIALAAMLGFMILVFWLSVVPWLERSVSQRTKNARRKEMPISRRLTASLSAGFIGQNFKRVVCVLFVIALLVGTMGISQVYSKQFQQTEKYEIAFQLASSTGFASRTVYPFQFNNWKGNLFSIRDIAELEAMPGVLNVTSILMVNASMIIPSERSPYWNQFVEPDYDKLYGMTRYPSEGISGIPREGVTVLTKEINNFNVKILTKENLATYLEAYPDLPVERMRQEKAVALVLPPVENGDMQIHYDTLTEGEMLRFGRLSYAEDVLFSEVCKDPTLLHYEEIEMKIVCISEKGMITDRGYDSVQIRKPTVLLLEETAEETNLVKGYYSSLITTTGDISEADYAALEAKVTQIALSNPGSVVQSAREEREQNQELMRIVNLSLGMILGVFGVFTVIAIYSALYMTILQRKRSLAIYRARGLPRWKLAMAMLLELLFYWLLAILLAFVMSMIAFHAIWHIANLPYMGMPMMRVLVLALLAGLPLNGFIVWSLQRNIYSESVYAAMRLGE